MIIIITIPVFPSSFSSRCIPQQDSLILSSLDEEEERNVLVLLLVLLLLIFICEFKETGLCV